MADERDEGLPDSGQPSPVAVFEQQVRANLAWNTAVYRSFMVFWGMGIGFFGLSTIVPVFMAQAGISRLLIGIIPSAYQLSILLPQLFSAHLTAGRVRKKAPLILAHVPGSAKTSVGWSRQM